MVRSHSISISSLKHTSNSIAGSLRQIKEDLLQQMQHSHHSQGHPVQSWQGCSVQTWKETIRHEAEGFRRSDQAHFQKEVKDHQEDHLETGLH